jgi:hypothetical protein
VVDVMHKLEALQILKTKLAAIEEHHAEYADNELVPRPSQKSSILFRTAPR